MKRLLEPTSVLPLELFRIVTGVMAVLYFGQLWLEFPDYADPQLGFLDHDLVRRIFWFTGVTLFQPGFSNWLLRGYLLLGMAGALCTFSGVRARQGAAVAWVVAVSYFRWIFPVVNLNDSSVQLCLIWTMLFPVGQSLRLDEWWRQPGLSLRERLRGWLRPTTPQAIVWVYLLYFTMAYEVVGLSKWTSAYWRDGIALYIVLRLPLARSHDFWRLAYLPILRIGNYVSLLLEPLIPVGFWVPRSSKLKFVLLGGALMLHGGILLTIGIADANVSWLLVQLIVFREEITGSLGRWCQAAPISCPPAVRLGLAPKVALVMLGIVGLSMTEGVPGIGNAYGVGFGLQWSVGLAQEYHLFDWIDKFNYVVDNRVMLRHSDGSVLPIAKTELFPDTLRGFLVQSYLHDMRWMRVPRGESGELRRSLLERAAARLGRRLDDSGEVTVESTDQRATPDNLALDRARYRVMMRFRVDQGRVTMIEPY